MKKIISICFLFTVLICKSYAVVGDYIPSDSKLVFSANLGKMTSKTDISVQEFLNELFLDELSKNFSDNMDNDFLAKAIVNDAATIFNFDKYMRVIAFNNYDVVALLEVGDIIDLNFLVLKIAREEETSIETADDGKFNYLDLDGDAFFAWNNETFAIIANLNGRSDTMYATAESIFSKEAKLENEVFVGLEKNKSDISFWIDNDPETSNMSLISLISENMIGSDLLENEYLEYKESTLTFEINFKKADVELAVNVFMPNISTDVSKLYKPIRKDIYSFIPNDVLGFMSLSFDPKVLHTILYSKLKDTQTLEELNSSIFTSGQKDVLEILEKNISGDLVFSVWNNMSEDAVDPYIYAASIGINNKKDIISILEILEITEDEELKINNIPVYSLNDGELFAIVQEKTMYIASYEALNYIINLKKPALTDTKKINLISKNIVSLYANLNSEIEDIKDVTVVYKIVSATQFGTIVNLATVNDDSFKSMFYLLKSLF